MSRAELPAHCRLHLSTCPQLASHHRVAKSLHHGRACRYYSMYSMYSTACPVLYLRTVHPHPPDGTWDVAPCTVQGPTCANMPAEWEQRYYRYYRKYRTEVLLIPYSVLTVLSFRVVDGLVRFANSASSFGRVKRSVLVYACTDMYSVLWWTDRVLYRSGWGIVVGATSITRASTKVSRRSRLDR
jgi:hypothetical protein